MPQMPPIHLYLHYPAVASVVAVESEGRINALACAWHTALSFAPPLYAVAISPKRFSHQLLTRGEYFTVNFLPFEKADLIARFGRNSGRDVDKFAAWDVDFHRPEGLPTPVLSDAYAAYICRKVDQRTYGDHDLFVGEIVRVWMDEYAFTSAQVLDVSRVRPALYLGSDHYLTADENVEVHRGREEEMEG